MMIDALSRGNLRTLMETKSNPCISLYLPTDRTGVARQQDQLRIRRLVREAESLLTDQEHQRAAQVEDVLEPIRTLLEDEQFWQHASDGLAIFRSPQVFRTYRLPASFKERVVFSDHFYLKPLLPLLTDDERFYVLALSHNAVRLLACTHYCADELKLPEQVPTSLAEFLKYEEHTHEIQKSWVVHDGHKADDSAAAPMESVA